MDQKHFTPQAPDDHYVDIKGAVAELRALGFADVTLRKVRRWAGDRELPFFPWGKRLYIEIKELRASFKRRQIEAVQRVRKPGQRTR